jgi:hypothetical protein
MQRRMVAGVKFNSVSSSKAQEPSRPARESFLVHYALLSHLPTSGFLWNIVPHELCVSSSKAQEPAGLRGSPFSFIMLFFLIYLRLDFCVTLLNISSASAKVRRKNQKACGGINSRSILFFLIYFTSGFLCNIVKHQLCVS